MTPGFQPSAQITSPTLPAEMLISNPPSSLTKSEWEAVQKLPSAPAAAKAALPAPVSTPNRRPPNVRARWRRHQRSRGAGRGARRRLFTVTVPLPGTPTAGARPHVLQAQP
eukprot:363432-Chlamydomonas_euryale.AAC.2